MGIAEIMSTWENRDCPCSTPASALTIVTGRTLQRINQRLEPGLHQSQWQGAVEANTANERRLHNSEGLAAVAHGGGNIFSKH